MPDNDVASPANIGLYSDTLQNGFSRRQIAVAISPRIQELILLPTEKCNFRCTYCYEDFELGKMSEATQQAIELYLDRRVPELKKLSLSWFGGEPLVAKDVVLRLAHYAKTLCESHNVFFHGGLTTNAYILDVDLAKELLSLNQNFFQITLDGWKEGHDVLRKRADGRGTFDVIWQNLLGLKSIEQNFEVCVRVHVRRDNFENLVILMREYAKAFGSDARFRLDFQHLRDMGGDGGKSVIDAISLVELPTFEKKLRTIFVDELARLSGDAASEKQKESLSAIFIENQTHDDQLVVHASNAGESSGSRRSGEDFSGEPYICYAARPNSLLIRSNGRIGKCTVAFDDDRNDLGYLNDNGELVINNEKLQPWIRGLGTLNPEVNGCPISGMAESSLLSPYPGNSRQQRVVEFYPSKQL